MILRRTDFPLVPSLRLGVHLDVVRPVWVHPIKYEFSRCSMNVSLLPLVAKGRPVKNFSTFSLVKHFI